jgi:hypothetical protein
MVFSGRGASSRPEDWPPSGLVVIRVLRLLLSRVSWCSVSRPVLRHLG